MAVFVTRNLSLISSLAIYGNTFGGGVVGGGTLAFNSEVMELLKRIWKEKECKNARMVWLGVTEATGYTSQSLMVDCNGATTKPILKHADLIK